MTVIKFPERGDELEHTSYTEGVDDDSIGVATLDRGIEIVRLNDDDFMVIAPNDSQVFDRQALAEFLHVASIFLDSEQRWLPEIPLVGCDYE